MQIEDHVRQADEADVAASYAAIQTEDAIAEVRARAVARETHPDFDGAHCVDCWDEMPQVRLEAGRVRCTTCQSILEEKKKRGLM